MPLSVHLVDQALLNWGDRLFREPLRHARTSLLSQQALGEQAQGVRRQIARTLARAPEVFATIAQTGAGVRGMKSLSHHLRYISRNGEVELEDQDRHVIAGSEALHDLIDLWRVARWGIPQQGARREALNVVLSMPPGTDPLAVQDAARAFAADEFGDGRLYVLAVHCDTDHPHVHLCVQTRGADGRRLAPFVRDRRRWRERFAQHLRELGVDANATSRLARGETRLIVSWVTTHMLRRGEVPQSRRTAPEVDDHRRQWEAHVETLQAWRELARALAQSERADDRRMAIGIVDFVRTMPVVRERLEITQEQSVMAAGRWPRPGRDHASVSRDPTVPQAPLAVRDTGIER